MRFYFDKINYDKIYIQVGHMIYLFDLDELAEDIPRGDESVEKYCNLAEWEFGDHLFDLNNDKEYTEFLNIDKEETEYTKMIVIIKNCVMRYILDNRTDYTIDQLKEILGYDITDDLTDILNENLKEFKFIK